jgi:hypothetical protein
MAITLACFIALIFIYRFWIHEDRYLTTVWHKITVTSYCLLGIVAAAGMELSSSRIIYDHKQYALSEPRLKIWLIIGLISLLCSALFFVWRKCRAARHTYWTFTGTALTIGFLLSIPALDFLNCMMDRSPTNFHQARVVDKTMKRGRARGPRLHLQLTNWEKPGTFVQLQLPWHFCKVNINEIVT